MQHINPKKLISILLIVLFSCLTVVPAFAIGKEDIYFNNDLVFDEEEYAIVINGTTHNDMVQRSGADNVSLLSNDAPQGYKLFYLNTTYFAEKLQTGEHLKDMISQDYVWIIPIKSVNDVVVKASFTDGQAEVLGYSYRMPGAPIVASDVIDFDVVYEAIADLPAEDIQVQCFDAYEYSTKFTYVFTPDNEYLIPFSARPDFNNMENGKLYSLEEACLILQEAMPFVEYDTTKIINGHAGAAGNSKDFANPTNDTKELTAKILYAVNHIAIKLLIHLV